MISGLLASHWWMGCVTVSGGWKTIRAGYSPLGATGCTGSGAARLNASIRPRAPPISRPWRLSCGQSSIRSGCSLEVSAGCSLCDMKTSDGTMKEKSRAWARKSVHWWKQSGEICGLAWTPARRLSLLQAARRSGAAPLKPGVMTLLMACLRTAGGYGFTRSKGRNSFLPPAVGSTALIP